MKKQTCCFTGHREIPLEQYEKITQQLRLQIITLIHKNVVYFLTGGALGFDTLAAQTILELKKIYPQIKLILILPCKDQTLGWSLSNIEKYENIKKACDTYFYISDVHTRYCMYERNRYLVDCSNYCICYLTKSSGGTAYTVRYAKKNGLTVINLAN